MRLLCNRINQSRNPLEVFSLPFKNSNNLAWGETYLVNYNAISAFFWFNIPLRLIQIYNLLGPDYVHEIADYVKYVQSVAILELIHSATGILSRLFSLAVIDGRTRSSTDNDNLHTSFLKDICGLGDR